MRKLILFCLIFSSFFSFGQNAQDIISDLKKELNSNPDEKKKATIYSDLTWYYSSVSLDSSFGYGSKAIEMSRKIGDSIVLAQVYSDLGAAYFRKGDFYNSEKNYLSAYKIRKIRKDESGLAKININLGSIYTSKQMYKSAMKAYLESIAFFEKNKNYDIVNNTKVNIGYLFNEMKNYPKAIKYLTEAIKYEQENKLDDRMCTSCLNLGNVYLQTKDTLKAIEYYKKSMFSCKKSGNKNGLSSVYNNLSAIKISQNKDATSLLNKTEEIRNELKSELSQHTTKINLVKNLINQKKYNQSKSILIELKNYFEKNASKENLLLTYNLFIPVCANLNQPDSVNVYLNKYSEIRNKLTEASVLKQTNELETKYQTAQKEKEILKKDLELKKSTYLTFGLIILMLLIGLIAYLLLHQQKIKNSQQKQEFELKTALAKIETQNELQEQRLSISRDLHDNIGSQLTFVISSIENLKFGFSIENPKIVNKLEQISDFTKSTITGLRDTIWAMNSTDISFEDLQVRILNFIESARNAKDNVNFQFNVPNDTIDVKFSALVWVNLYRTIQEAINNAIKYSNAKNIVVNINQIDTKTEVCIKDDGIGFNKDEVELGNGLLNMAKRIESINGKIDINSVIGKGTIVTIEI